MLELVAARLLCAVAEPHLYEETAATLVCAGQEFAAKGKTIQRPGWRRLDAAYHAGLKNAPEPEGGPEEKTLPELSQGQSLPVSNASVKEGKTSPPKHFTEDTLLSAMERAGAEDMPDAAAKGNPTQAQRSGLRGEKEGQRNGANACRQAGVAECSLSRRGLGTPATRASILEKLVQIWGEHLG